MMFFLTDSRSLAVRLTTAVIMISLLNACGGSSNRISKENDKLRRNNLQLDREVQKLRQIVKEQADQLASSDGPLVGAIAHRIALDRYSGGIDTNNDGHDDLIRLYVRTFDAQDRFVPTTGLATVQVASLTAESSVKLVAQKQYNSSQWNKAYRSGLTGTHYTLEIALPAEVVGALEQVTVKVQWTDLAGKNALSTQQAVRLQ